MASKRNVRKKRCTGKKRYVNRPDAWGALRALGRKGMRGMQIYKCSFCKKWHIGHPPKRKYLTLRQ